MIAGVDLSSRSIDIVLLSDDDDSATWYRFTIAVKGGTAFDAARLVRDTFPGRHWWKDHGVWLIGLEDPFSRNQGTAKALGLVTGALLACIPAEMTIVRTAPGEWKREFTGEAIASKDRVVGWCVARGFKPEATEYDPYDAYGIAYAVRAMNQRGIEAA